MLKNKKIILFYIALIILCIAGVNSGMCAEEIAQHIPETAQSSELHSTIFKFLKVMGGVALSSVIIFAGLWIYNRFIVKDVVVEKPEERNTLATPKNIDSAIAFFIKRNKM